MKKKVFALLLLAGMVLGTGQAAFAADKEIVPKDYEIINNGDGQSSDRLKEGVKIPVQGTLGELDPSNPEESIPEGDSKWIKVELPTKVLFNTLSTDKLVIESADYHITNLSARPLKVNLSSFASKEKNAAHEAIGELYLTKSTAGKPTETKVKLVNQGVDQIKTNTELVTLKAINPANVKDTFNFQYTGGTLKDKLTANRMVAKYDMTLKFEVLDTNGKPVVKP